jgi:hypothetical protein
MSHHASTWAWAQVGIDDGQKIVLLCLADHHNGETGRCDPSLPTIMRRCGIRAKDTVIERLRALEAGDFIETVRSPGRGNAYRLLIGGEPVENFDRSGTPDQSKTSTGPVETVDRTSRNCRPEPGRNQEETRKPNNGGAERDVAAKAARIRQDWSPSPSDRAFASELGLDAVALADEFRDYWVAVPGSKGRKLDWPATWRNHCRRRATRQSGRSPPRQSAMPLGAPPPVGPLPTSPVAWSALSADEAATATDMLSAMGRPEQDGLFGGWVLQAARDLIAEGIPPDVLRETAGAFARSRSGRDMLAEEAAADAAALDAVGRRLFRWMQKVARAKRDERPPPANIVPLRRAEGAD